MKNSRQRRSTTCLHWIMFARRPQKEKSSAPARVVIAEVVQVSDSGTSHRLLIQVGDPAKENDASSPALGRRLSVLCGKFYC